MLHDTYGTKLRNYTSFVFYYFGKNTDQKQLEGIKCLSYKLYSTTEGGQGKNPSRSLKMKPMGVYFPWLAQLHFFLDYAFIYCVF